jgi:hypothetical protein
MPGLVIMVSEMVRKRIDLLLWLLLGFIMYMTIPIAVRVVASTIGVQCVG